MARPGGHEGRKGKKMNISGVYDFTVSEIDGNGYQYYTGMLEPERLDSHGMRFGTAFHISIDHKKQTSELCKFSWIGGAPHNFESLSKWKDEVLGPSEVETILKKFGLL